MIENDPPFGLDHEPMRIASVGDRWSSGYWHHMFDLFKLAIDGNVVEDRLDAHREIFFDSIGFG